MEATTQCRRPACEEGGGVAIRRAYRNRLENSALATFDGVMASDGGRCLRVLPDRENWYVRAGGIGMYLKKHRARTWSTWIAALLGGDRPSAGRIEAENALALESHGIDVMPLVAFGERLRADGVQESFLLSEELDGYCELQDFVRRRFKARCGGLHGDRDLRRLVVQVAEIARRFHAAGFNHRDFYCCHFLVKEPLPGTFDVRLIDLQRVQRRRWFRRRWIVKDLAQLDSMSPDDCLDCRAKVLFLRTYLGVAKLRPEDKRLIGEVLRKSRQIRRRARRKA